MTRTPSKWILLLAGIIVWMLATTSYADPNTQERIIDFASTIVVNKDASLNVKEVITVYANRDKINRGIIRRLPTQYTDTDGMTHTLHYAIERVMRNRYISAYHLESSSDQLIVYVGQNNKPLNPDKYAFTLQYHVANAIRSLNDTDELYWNVTGHDWDLPILKASADIILPDEAAIKHYTAYMGFKGDIGHHFTINQSSPHQLTLATTASLLPNQGLAVAISWQKGVVNVPNASAILPAAENTNQMLFLLMEMTIGTLAYYLIALYWHKGPKHLRATDPLTQPPDGFSPAAIRYLTRQHDDLKTFTAALVSIATKGGLIIQHEGAQLAFIDTGNSHQLTQDEMALKAALFQHSNMVTLGTQHAKTILNAKKRLELNLHKKLMDTYFKSINVYILLGWCLTACGFGVALLSANDVGATVSILLTSIFWVLFYGFFTTYYLKGIKENLFHPSLKHLYPLAFAIVVILVFIISTGFMVVVLFNAIALNTLPALLALIALNVLFYSLLKTPTPKGQKLLDQIYQFKLFLATPSAEHDTREVFEKYLAFAIALDVEGIWQNHFDSLFKATSN